MTNHLTATQLADQIQAEIERFRFPQLSGAEWQTVLNALRSSGPESDGGITQALVEMARANAIEECARSLEPANHPLLMAAVKTIRALSSSATSEMTK